MRPGPEGSDRSQNGLSAARALTPSGRGCATFRPVAVCTTRTGAQQARPTTGRRRRRACPVFSMSPHGLKVELTAFPLPILCCIFREHPRVHPLLPAGPSRSWLNKRWPARYSISFTDVKRERSDICRRRALKPKIPALTCNITEALVGRCTWLGTLGGALGRPKGETR
jgi:hypothetical protein